MTTKTKSYYQTIAEGLSERHRQILDYLSMVMEPRSRAVISESTGLSLQCVCGRVNELLKMGMLALDAEAFDINTNRWVETVTANQGIDRINAIEKKPTTKQLKDKIADLESNLLKLKGYARHDFSCEAITSQSWGAECNCGLDELRAESEKIFQP